jgi:hypothetical protein
MISWHISLKCEILARSSPEQGQYGPSLSVLQNREPQIFNLLCIFKIFLE